jgi:ribosome-associated toxin RatA of RatAB toxin-antitoxin module
MHRAALALVTLILVSIASASVWATPTPETARLRRLHPKAEKYRVARQDTSMEAGAARTFVAAPVNVTRDVVTDYARYARMIPRFEQARIVGRRGDKTDVYLRVPILKGAATIWAVLRFNPPRQVDDGDYVITAKMLSGNVKRFDAVYWIRRVDDASSQLHLEMLIEPKFPAPKSIVADQVAGACKNAVSHLRADAEKRNN